MVTSRQFIVLIGPAGSGKTTLTGAFGKWVEDNQHIKVGYINLDPGVEYLPYRPDIDAREFVTVNEVMRRFKLGPNGALIKSVDLLLEFRDRIQDSIESMASDYIIVDTPGQMELFLFRSTGPVFMELFKKMGFTVGVLVIDPTLAYRAVDIVALKLLAMIIQFRLGVDSLLVVNKYDSLIAQSTAQLIDDPNSLESVLSSSSGVLSEVAEEFLKIMSMYGLASRIIKISALTGMGLDDFYDLLHEVYCTCGDLT